MRIPMMLHTIMTVLVATGLFRAIPVHAHDRHGRQERLAGRAYDRMRELAHRLDERAQQAADQAVEGVHHGGRRERGFLDAITHFAGQTADLHERMDRYRESPWNVPGEIEHLVRDARKVNERIRAAHVFEHTWDDWDAVLDVLDRMQHLAGDANNRDGYRFQY